MLIVLAVGACSRSNVEPIRIGYNEWPGYEVLYLADQLRLFQKHGVRVSLQDFASFSDVLRAYQEGRLEGATMTLVEFLRISGIPDPPVAVLAIDASAGSDGIVARPGIGGMRELKGRRIGVESLALGGYVLGRALDRSGMTLSDVIPVNMTPDEEGMDAFRNGRIDALVTFEPSLSELERTAGGKKIFSSREIPNEIIDVLVFSPRVLKTRRADCKRVLEAWFEAMDYWAAHPKEAEEIMSRRERTSPEMFRESLQGLTIYSREDNLRLFGQADGKAPLLETAGRIDELIVRYNLAKGGANVTALLDGSLVRSLPKRRP